MREPVTLGGAFIILVNSLLATAVLLKAVSLEPMQVAGINLVVVNLVAFVALAWSRMLSTPVAAPTLPAGTEVTVVTPAAEPNRIVTL